MIEKKVFGMLDLRMGRNLKIENETLYRHLNILKTGMSKNISKHTLNFLYFCRIKTKRIIFKIKKF